MAALLPSNTTCSELQGLYYTRYIFFLCYTIDFLCFWYWILHYNSIL